MTDLKNENYKKNRKHNYLRSISSEIKQVMDLKNKQTDKYTNNKVESDDTIKNLVPESRLQDINFRGSNSSTHTTPYSSQASSEEMS